MSQWKRFGAIALLSSLIVFCVGVLPLQAHVRDLSLANIIVQPQSAQIKLTLPTSLMAFADDDNNQQLSSSEIRAHREELEAFFGDRLRLTDNWGKRGTITVEAGRTQKTLMPTSVLSSNIHSTLSLKYAWSRPFTKLRIEYRLFDNLPNAHCLSTIIKNGELENYIFTPTTPTLSIDLGKGASHFAIEGGLLAIAVAFSWGAVHALSPGHGKTLVGAYLIGSRAKPIHAIFLGLTTTIAHTLGVFILGIVAFFASRYVLPERFLPWLSLLSGSIVVAIGFNLLKNRLWANSSVGHHHHHHHHDEHHHHHHHDDDSHEPHTHFPTDASHAPITWRSLMALGIAGGLVPCPAALVLLFSTMALGQTGLGLLLVSVFSLGLAVTLTGLGILLIGTKKLFEKLPTPIKLAKSLSIISAALILLVGVGLSYQAFLQIYP